MVAVVTASAISAAMPWLRKLLISFSLWPAPTGPMWKTFSEKVSSTGRIAASVASSAPTRVLSRPASASLGERVKRRIGEAHVLRRKRLGHALGRGGLGGGAVDHDQALVRAGHDAVLGEHAQLDLGGRRHAQDHHVARPGERGRALRLARAAAEQVLDRRPVAVREHAQRVAFLDDVLGHAVAHQTGADEADALRHLPLPAVAGPNKA